MRLVGLTTYRHSPDGIGEVCGHGNTKDNAENHSDRGLLVRSVIGRKNLEPRASSGRDSVNFFPGYVGSSWFFKFEVVKEKVQLVGTAFNLDLKGGARVSDPTGNSQLLCKAVDHGTIPDALYESAQDNAEAFGVIRGCVVDRHNSSNVIDCS